jgi:hypothetical protein
MRWADAHALAGPGIDPHVARTPAGEDQCMRPVAIEHAELQIASIGGRRYLFPGRRSRRRLMILHAWSPPSNLRDRLLCARERTRCVETSLFVERASALSCIKATATWLMACDHCGRRAVACGSLRPWPFLVSAAIHDRGSWRACRRSRRRSCALIATMIVLSDMSTAPAAGERIIPHAEAAPPASGMATAL